MSIVRILIAAASFALLLPADTLTLRNGNVLEGNYVGGNAREIRLEVNGGIQTFSIDSLVSIRFGAPSTNSPAPSRGQSSSSNYPSPTQQNNNADSLSANSGVELPAGTQLTVRMIDSVDSDVSRTGDTFRASIDEPVMVNGQAVISRGADVVARLVDDQKSGKIQGRTVLKLVLTSVSVNGRPVEISTQDVIKESSSRGARSAKVIGGTTALGAIIGGIAGGGRGAAIGAGSGAAVGTGAQEVTKGQRVRISSETRLVFTLSYSVRA